MQAENSRRWSLLYLGGVCFKCCIRILSSGHLHSLCAQRTHKSGALSASLFLALMSLIAAMIETIRLPTGVALERQKIQLIALFGFAVFSQGQQISLSHHTAESENKILWILLLCKYDTKQRS